MRLLHTKTLLFEEYFDGQIPKYAILSHRWEGQEVSFQELKKGRAGAKSGLKKIKDCCQYAASRGLEYVWIDTCCIDKKSSAELSEAINSMYSWYANAVECYASLADVEWIEYRDQGASEPIVSAHSWDQFRKSEWFTRGWTLQELLAPWIVIFFDQKWRFIGSKSSTAAMDDASRELSSEISAITGIDRDYLSHSMDILSASLAQRMSWASKRITSRQEDIAYSLLGLFNVNMPLLYGEGQKAFMRLELEIIKYSNDESIFAWTSHDEESGMLASSPRAFVDSGDIRVYVPPKGALRPPYAMTNRGLQFYTYDTKADCGDMLVHLQCARRETRLFIPLAITIREKHDPDNQWCRIRCSALSEGLPQRSRDGQYVYVEQLELASSVVQRPKDLLNPDHGQLLYYCTWPSLMVSRDRALT